MHYIYYKYGDNEKLKIINIKNCTCCYLDDTIQFEYFDLDSIIIKEKSYEKFLVYKISCKNWIDDNLSILSLIQLMNLLEFMIEQDIWT